MRFDDFINNKGHAEDFKLSKQADEPAKISVNIEEKPTQKELMPITKTQTLPTKEIEKPSFNRLALLEANLNNCLKIIDDEVMKGYLTKLSDLPIVPLDENWAEALPPVQFFKITELVYQEGEFSAHKLSTMFSALSGKPCTLILMIASNGETNDFYLGARSKDSSKSTGTMLKMLRQTLKGLFPGTRSADYYSEALEKDLEKMSLGAISSATCVADYRERKNNMNDKEFVQGLEKFVNSMHGQKYRAFFIADTAMHESLKNIKRDYEEIYTQISPFANMNMTFSTSSNTAKTTGESEGRADSKNFGVNKGTSESQTYSKTFSVGKSRGYGSSDTKGTSKSESDGTSEGTSHTDGTSTGHSAGGGAHTGLAVAGANVYYGYNWGKNSSDSQSNTISRTLSHGISNAHTKSLNYGESEGKSSGESFGTSASEGVSYGVGEAISFSQSKSLTDSLGKSESISLCAKNMTLTSVLNRLEKQLQRIDECESLGMWNFAAYFVGESLTESETAANIYQSVVSGIKSGIETSAINTWHEDEKISLLTPYIKNFIHPVFKYHGFDYEGDRYVNVTPAVLVSTNELTIHMGLPYRSVKGLPVIEHAVFAQEVLKKSKDDKELNLGSVYHLGNTTKTPVNIDLNSLTMHTFVTGSTGAGKSNAVYHILSEAAKNNIPFLVVEPAKGEYRKVFKDVPCFGTNPKIGNLLRLNPFAFPKSVHVLEHIDRLTEIFNVCWPMYAAMPAVLKDSIERAYEAAGWDTELSENSVSNELFPTFDDVLSELNEIIETSNYSEETKGDYIGSLSTRLKSLTNGINGCIFSGNETDLSKLFNNSAILDISRVGSMETKSLIMGLVVLKLQEFRMSENTEMNSSLRHLTVLEEAHNLLKKTSTEQSAESSNMTGKSVEMLTNTIAEIRTFGEGFIIVDQAPDLLDTSAIRNTNTKIVLRLPEGNDRKITGAAMALNEKQIKEISKLPTGVAAVYQNDWQEALLSSLPYFENGEDFAEECKKDNVLISEKEKNNRLLHNLLKNNLSEDEEEKVKLEILNANAGAKIRLALINNLHDRGIVYEWAVSDFIEKKYMFKNIFRGTGNGEWETLSELTSIMANNIRAEFNSFSDEEMKKILYYICLMENFNGSREVKRLREFLKREAYANGK